MPRIGEAFNPYGLFHGIHIPEYVCKYRGLSPGAKMAYGRFCRYAGRNGEAFPSISTLAKEIGLGETQARSYVAELVDEKFITIDTTKGKVNNYVFLWHKCFDGDIGYSRFNPPPRDAEVVQKYHQVLTRDAEPPRDADTVPPRDAEPEESHSKRVIEKPPIVPQRGTVREKLNQGLCVEKLQNPTAQENLFGSVTEKTLVTVDRMIQGTAEQINKAHPSDRRCGPAKTAKLIKAAIARHGVKKQSEVPDFLKKIEDGHTRWLYSESWSTNDGQYVKSMKGWIEEDKFLEYPRASVSVRTATNQGMIHKWTKEDLE